MIKLADLDVEMVIKSMFKDLKENNSIIQRKKNRKKSNIISKDKNMSKNTWHCIDGTLIVI